MAVGKAVVANDHPEQKSVIKQSGGGICVSYLETDFAEAVIRLLSNADLARKMGKNGKDWVYQNRTYSKIADLLESAYFVNLPER